MLLEGSDHECLPYLSHAVAEMPASVFTAKRLNCFWF